MSQDEKRASGRHSFPIEIEFWCDATHHKGRIEDLSEGGLYIYTGLNWPVGTPIAFTFTLPNSPKLVLGTGTVAWTEQMGFGIKFDALDDESKGHIRALVGDDRPQ